MNFFWKVSLRKADQRGNSQRLGGFSLPEESSASPHAALNLAGPGSTTNAEAWPARSEVASWAVSQTQQGEEKAGVMA